MSGSAIIECRDFSLAYRHADGWLRAVDEVAFRIGAGEVFGLVGESGCGKSSLAYSLLGYRAPSARVDGGEILYRGENILSYDRRRLDALRGAEISLVPQNPTTALNPAMRVGRQLVETMLEHRVSGTRTEARARAAELFGQVGLPQPSRIVRRYPHELSGGQQQRVCIAMALACDPSVVVLDEPTTGLDVTTQAQIIALLKSLRQQRGTAMLYVTHDLGVLAEIADRIGVMYAGQMVEVASSDRIFAEPRHPYTRGLIGSIPRVDRDQLDGGVRLQGLLRRGELPRGCPFAPRCEFAETACLDERQRLKAIDEGHVVACRRWRAVGPMPKSEARQGATVRSVRATERPVLEVAHLTVRYGSTRGLGRLAGTAAPPAVRDVSLTIHSGETFALVGESGSGKSTIAKAISGLVPPVAGGIRFRGEELAPRLKVRPREVKRQIQFIFQNPDASLNPRMRVGSSLARPLDVLLGVGGREARARIERALDEVRLEAGYRRRYPDQLSGGERQRVAIARALVADPTLLLCDEILSALDVSVQANILDLLRRLRKELELAMLFISHDLAVVRTLADRVGVLFRGALVEVGEVEAVYRPPFHPYTYELLLAVPGSGLTEQVVETEAVEGVSGRVPTELGCPYAERCPFHLGAKCDTEVPPWRQAGATVIRCHIPTDELERLTRQHDDARKTTAEMERA